MKIIIILISIVSTALSQNAYELTPGVKGNQIIIQLNNSSYEGNISSVEVKLIKGSDNLLFGNTDLLFDNINFDEEKDASFNFDVKFNISSAKQDTIEFLITDNKKIYVKKQFIVNYLLPTEYNLDQNYPNPFNPTTKIRFTVPNGIINVGSFPIVELKVYDILGTEVTTLLKEQKEPGYYEIEFDASAYASGVYIYRLIAGSFVSTKKMMVLK